MQRSELKVNRRLLDTSFEGYKLGGLSCRPSRIKLLSAPARAKPHPDHQSLLHARLHALHNAIVHDVRTKSVYYVANDCSIWSVNLDSDNSLFCSLNPISNFTSAGEFPPTLKFSTTGMGVLATGTGRLILLNTANCRNVKPFKIEAESVPLGENVSFTVIDVRHLLEFDQVHCLLYCIESSGTHSKSILEWCFFGLREERWCFQRFRKLQCPAAVHFATFETNCKSLFIASDRPVDLVVDDVNDELYNSANKKNIENKKTYYWVQSKECVTLTLQANAGVTKEALEVITEDDNIEVRCDEIELLKGTMFKEIDNGLTTWSVDNAGKISIVMMKREAEVLWNRFLKNGDPNGEQILDSELVAEVHERLAHLCSENEVTSPNDAPLFNSQQLEECDFNYEEESCLMRYHCVTSEMTHKVSLSSNQIVLTVQLHPLEVPAIGLRYDADTCIWQPYDAIDDNIWELKHEGTLKAFGYIQSSKAQKKYTVCSPDLEYAVVCEPNRHVFVYHQGNKATKLRQRKPETEDKLVKIGRQQVITFDGEDEILGIAATNDTLYLLTERSIMYFDMTE